MWIFLNFWAEIPFSSFTKTKVPSAIRNELQKTKKLKNCYRAVDIAKNYKIQDNVS